MLEGGICLTLTFGQDQVSYIVSHIKVSFVLFFFQSRLLTYSLGAEPE